MGVCVVADEAGVLHTTADDVASCASYVLLDASDYAALQASQKPVNPATAGSFFFFSLSVIVGFWFFARKLSLVIAAVRKAF